MCRAVEIEPHLQPLGDEIFQQKTVNVQNGVHLDAVVNGFWCGCHERCYTDIRVFNHMDSGTTLNSCFKKHGLAKKRAYESRIREVHCRAQLFYSFSVFHYQGNGT